MDFGIRPILPQKGYFRAYNAGDFWAADLRAMSRWLGAAGREQREGAH
jgi:hypothetical protein